MGEQKHRQLRYEDLERILDAGKQSEIQGRAGGRESNRGPCQASPHPQTRDMQKIASM
jgi:hypothetical protein